MPEADRAMDTLSQAVAIGFVDLDRLDTDRQLLPLRSRPDFKALVSKLRSTTSQVTSADVSKAKPTPSTARPASKARPARLHPHRPRKTRRPPGTRSG